MILALSAKPRMEIFSRPSSASYSKPNNSSSSNGGSNGDDRKRGGATADATTASARVMTATVVIMIATATTTIATALTTITTTLVLDPSFCDNDKAVWLRFKMKCTMAMTMAARAMTTTPPA